MATISQVVSEESFEHFETNTVFPAQKGVSKTDETVFKSTVLTSVSKDRLSSSAKESFTTLEITDNIAKSSVIEDIFIKGDLLTNSPTPTAPVKLPAPSSELKSTALVRNVKSEPKAKIRTFEELLDSSSDLDLPSTPPPPVPESALPKAAVQLPVSVRTVSAQVSEPIIPSSSALPKSKETQTKKPSSSNINGSSNMSDEISTSPCTSSSAFNSNNSNDNRSTSVSPTPTTATIISASGGISTNHYERLIEELKCPGCASPMKAPIKLCATGHSICQHCTTVLMLCPLCKEPFIELRSLTLEALCSKAHFRCCNAAAGCTVRLQIELLNWHEKQCIWKSMKCFMGRVWGDCTWTGREAGWKDHLETAHADRVFKTSEQDLEWNMTGKIQPLSGYYVFEVYDEMFNFYQVHDRDRILFTMTVTSTVRDRKHNFAYEVEMFHKNNEALVLTQRFPVHSEYDKDILLDGTCVCVSLTDLARLIGPEKILNFRVRIHEVNSPKKSKVPKKPSRKHPINFQQTAIEGANLKSVPAGVIVTRKLENLPLEHFKDNDEEKDLTKSEDTSSSDDPEFEAFIEKNWGTPQMNFNRKYLRSSTSKESSSSSGSSILSAITDTTGNGVQRSSCEIGTKNKMRSVTSSLRKSFRSLKSDIIDLKKPFAKKSPEKKESLIKK